MIPELAKWQLFVGLFNPNLSTIYSMGFVDIIMVQKLCSSTTITHIFDEIQAAPTWVCVIPKLAANSARSGNARYCVLWNRRSNCWICKDEYMDRGFRIFFPFPLTRVISSPCSTTRSVSPAKSMCRWVQKGSPQWCSSVHGHWVQVSTTLYTHECVTGTQVVRTYFY